MRQKVIALIISSVVLTVVAEIAFSHFNAIENPASLESGDINTVFKGLIGIGLPFFIIPATGLILGLLFFRPNGENRGFKISSLPQLEAAWTFIPLAIILGVSAFGGVMLLRMEKPSQNELEIKVTASQYAFQFDYTDYGITSYELVVPVNQRIHFSLTSTDVVHSFWVQQWGPKQDLVPGMTTDLRITPTQIGNFTVVCNQLCGVGHTYMTAPVKVLSETDFAAWLTQQAPPASTTMPGMGP